MSVSSSFQTLLSRIEPLQSEVDSAQKHGATIRARLEDSFRLNRLLLVGSHSRKTAIRHHSDVDYFAVFARDDARWGDSYMSSTTFLDKIRIDLAERYSQTDVSRDAQAVVVHFGGGDFPVDVVPAIFWSMKGNRPLYQIPNGQGGWMPTSPGLHGQYIAAADQKSRGKLRRVSQLVKFWRECRNPRVPLSSFHVELVVAAADICAGAKSYAQCLAETFQLLSERGCAALRDPVGVSGNIPATKTSIQRGYAEKEVRYAQDHATRATLAETYGKESEARRQWDIVFNGYFPG